VGVKDANVHIAVQIDDFVKAPIARRNRSFIRVTRPNRQSDNRKAKLQRPRLARRVVESENWARCEDKVAGKDTGAVPRFELETTGSESANNRQERRQNKKLIELARKSQGRNGELINQGTVRRMRHGIKF
jgi:hypothetical protein